MLDLLIHMALVRCSRWRRGSPRPCRTGWVCFCARGAGRNTHNGAEAHQSPQDMLELLVLVALTARLTMAPRVTEALQAMLELRVALAAMLT